MVAAADGSRGSAGGGDGSRPEAAEEGEGTGEAHQRTAKQNKKKREEKLESKEGERWKTVTILFMRAVSSSIRRSRGLLCECG